MFDSASRSQILVLKEELKETKEGRSIAEQHCQALENNIVSLRKHIDKQCDEVGDLRKQTQTSQVASTAEIHKRDREIEHLQERVASLENQNRSQLSTHREHCTFLEQELSTLDRRITDYLRARFPFHTI